MPKLVTLPDVLYQVYVYGGLSRTENERPLTFRTFKKVMLGSELIVTEKTMHTKFEQIVASNFAKESVRNKDIIILNVPAIINELIYRKLLLGDLIPPSSESGAETHTQTHTQSEVSS